MKYSLRLMLPSVAMVLLMLAGAGSVPARAGSISEAQARTKAQSFLQSRRPLQSGKRLVVGNASKRSVPQLSNMGNSAPTPALYVFNIGEHDGFVIVSGDDRARSILGYADSGTFDADRIPAALSEMLTIYARQIEDVGAGPVPARIDSATQARKTPRRISDQMADVAPLLTTTWDQGDPYNAYCPTLDDQTALTGCVATAMAQIAYYHKYPTEQVPNLAAYTSETNKINVSAWGSTTFDWDNMLPSYSGSYTNAQKTAVATLMRYCGQAAQMDYGFTSGAYNGDAFVAFTQMLGYNANADFKSATSYSVNGWEDLIYKEVREGRPVYYSALNGDGLNGEVGGHAFVVDGYQADGNYFHVNWGWGGACNGYFNLFALDPDAPEATATSAGWHYQMLAIVGLSPESVNTAKLLKDASGSWLITSTDDWNELSANLETYNGGSFKLTQDISITTMIGTEWQHFSGIFDGQGHTLNLNIVTDLERTGPFHFTRDCTFKNLIIDGTFTTSNHGAGGLIGWAKNVTIQNCESRVTINSEFEGDGTCAGFVCLVRDGGPAYFQDCVFTGSIHGPNIDRCGGLCGWQDEGAYFSNCLNLGSFDIASNEGCATFCRNGAEVYNCYYITSLADYNRYGQGTAVTAGQLADGSIAQKLQSGQRDWTTGLVWGQLIGTDATPLLTNDASKGIYKVSFTVDGQVVKTIVSNSPLGDKMPVGADFGLTNATFTCNGAAFTGTTTFSSDITVTVTGTAAYTLTLNKPDNGTVSINNNACIPGTLKKVTATPADGFIVSSINVTDATGKKLPVTQVSNATNEYVFAFPKSSVTVTAEFDYGEADPVRFINGGMTLPSSWRSGDQQWTADTWMIWGDEYDGTDNVIVGTPPADALGHQWYEEGYALTNSDADEQPNGNKIVWENHAASFRDGGNYDYFSATGSEGDRNGDFYIRRIFTFNTQSVPAKLYMSCSYDDAPVEYYINGTLVYEDQKAESWHDGNYEIELTPAQIALIHTDGTPNVLAVHVSQNWGGYHLDCGLYDPTVLSYEVTGEQTLRVVPNAFLAGDVVIPENVTYNGVTYTVTEMSDDATNDCPDLTSISIPKTITDIGTWVFINDNSLQWVKSYIPVYQVYEQKILMAAPVDAAEFEVDEDCSRIWNNAFKFTDKLTTLTLPRSLTYVGYEAFVGCTSLTDIYAYARPVPSTEWNAFEGIDKSKITVHVYASALDSYKQTWGEEFQYVTMTDPQPITLTIDVADAGSLNTLIEEAVAEKSSTVYDVTGITVTGNLNQDDLRTLSAMCTGVYSLTTIDISTADIEGNYIEGYMFNGREKLTSIKLSETLEYIDEYAFNDCQGLTAIHIPASVKRIHSYAFDNCLNLVSVTGCEGLTDTYAWEDWYIFGWTPNVEGDVYGGTTFLSLDKDATGEYEVPAGIKVIVGGSMHGRNISSVIIPASVTDLGNDVFRGCHQLKDFYVYATTPPVCHDGSMEYDYDKSQATLHVPASALDAYQNAEEWREFGRIVAMASYELTVNVATPGTFSAALAGAMDEAGISTVQAISKLTVNGSLDDADLKELATVGTDNGIIDIRSRYTIVSDALLIAVDSTAVSLTFDNSLSTIHKFAFAGCSDLRDIYFTNSQRVPTLPANAFGDEDVSKVTLHVYESYLEHFYNVWGDEFQYVTMPDADDLVLIFTNEPLYLYNVDAGLYFAPGNAYGTQASLSTEPMEVRLESAPGDSYIIKTYDGTNELFMEGDNCFADRGGREHDYYWEFLPQDDGTFLIRMAGSNTYEGHTPANYPGKYFGRSDLSGTWLSHMADINDANAQIRWQLIYLSDIVNTELAEEDYAALCAISNTLDGGNWRKKWDTTTHKATKKAWPGVVIGDDGHVTAIALDNNNLSGDISSLTLEALTALKSLILSNNAITGDIQPLAASLPDGCTLGVEHQELGYQGEHTLYEMCQYGGLPSIAYWQSESGTLAQTLVGVNGVCQFYHEGTAATNGQYWDSYIYADGGTANNFKFYWPSPATVECFQPHHFTFTYRYEMGDANMDDALNVLDLQATLNYSNGQSWGLFNAYAADTYAQDNDINVQDIVATVNILLEQEAPAAARTAASTVGSGFAAATASITEDEASITVENGQIVLYTTVPVAALDLRLTGIAPETLTWSTEAMGFATAARPLCIDRVDAQGSFNGTRAIIYSLQPREIAEGRTVLATFDGSICPSLASAVLSDAKARPISVGSTVPTDISANGIMRNGGNERIFDLQGRQIVNRKSANRQSVKGVYLMNGKKVVVK